MPFTDGVRGHTPYKFFGVLIPSSGRPAFYGGSQSLGVSPFYNQELNRTVYFLKTQAINDMCTHVPHFIRFQSEGLKKCLRLMQGKGNCFKSLSLSGTRS